MKKFNMIEFALICCALFLIGIVVGYSTDPFSIWLISALKSKDSIVAVHGGLIAGILAVIAAYTSISQIRVQIKDMRDARKQANIAAVKAYIGLLRHYMYEIQNLIRRHYQIKDIKKEEENDLLFNDAKEILLRKIEDSKINQRFLTFETISNIPEEFISDIGLIISYVAWINDGIEQYANGVRSNDIINPAKEGYELALSGCSEILALCKYMEQSLKTEQTV